MIKNTAGQSIGAQMINATTGAAFAGTVTVYITIDAGTQAIGTVGAGVCTLEGNGYYTYLQSQAETNGSLIAYTFIGSGAIPQTIQVATLTPAQAASIEENTGVGTFAGLYGNDLDRELGSADRSELFTLSRRKAAINAGQLEFVKRTDCLQRQTAITLVTDTQEYDLETVTDFAWIAKQGLAIKIVSGTTTRYIEGDDLTVTTDGRLSLEAPGWRAVSKGTPESVYIRQDGGAVYVGLHPKPSITVGDVWTLILPYVVVPDDLSADSDAPFTVNGNALVSMRPWYRALVHYAAYDLEKLRKDIARSGAQLQLFEAEVQKFIGQSKPKNGTRVRLAFDYRRKAVFGQMPRRFDPRVTP